MSLSLSPQPLIEYKKSLKQALSACKSSFAYIGFISFFVNILVLVPSIYMLQIYDHVMASNNLSTLSLLTVLLIFLLCMMGFLEWVRSVILIVTSNRLDYMLRPQIFNSMFYSALGSGGRSASSQPLSDLQVIRQFLTSNTIFAFFDAPWLPMNIIVMWLFHWTYGVLAVLSSFILMGLNMWMEVGTRGLSNKANRENIESSQHTQRNLRNVEAIEAMGMLNRLRQRWERKQSAIVGTQSKANAKSSLVTTISKVYRMTLQSLALGLGAYLVITKEITPGAMFAGSMLLGRALAPLDLLIASWKGFVSARESYFRLEKSLQSSPSASSPMPLPPPSGHITLNNVTVIPQGEKKPILAGVNLQILPGEQIAVIGPSAAGKSTLIRTLLGLYKTSKGSVRMDGAEIQQWDRETLGNSIGFLPQDVELLDGTVSENIARFGEIDSEKVINATTMAGIHHIILSLPDGYDTKIEGQGAILSAGQRQRLGLARALYNLPKIIILDEPNSNLDQEGEQALAKVLLELKNIGSTVIVVTHRPNLLGLVDKIILMRNAQVVMFGSRDDILKALNQGPTQRIK